MPNDFYLKFINFLKKHNLYDEKVLKYVFNESIAIDINNYDFVLGSCHLVINNKNGKLEQIIPCMPNIMDDYSVIIAIFTYVNTLLLLPKLNKYYDDNCFSYYFTPLFYENIYVLENSSVELLEYEIDRRKQFLKHSPDKFKFIFNFIDNEIRCYKDNSNNKQLAKKVKRLAKSCVNI